MEIIDAKWTPGINILIVRCFCGNILEHRADRWSVRCRKCGLVQSLHIVRERYCIMAKQAQQQAQNKGKPNSGGKPAGDGIDPVIAKRLKQMNEKWEQSREESIKPGYGEGTTLSDSRHICRLSGARIVMAKDAPAVVFEFTAVQGDEIGEKAVRFCNFGKDEQIVYLQRDLRKLGANVDEFDATQLPKQLTQLLEEAPAVRITVRTNGEYKNVYIDKLVSLDDEGGSTGEAGGDEPGDDATDTGDDTGDAGETGDDAGDTGDDSGDTQTGDDDDGELPPDKGDKVAVVFGGKKVKGEVVSYNVAKDIAMVQIPKVAKPQPFKKAQLTILAA